MVSDSPWQALFVTKPKLSKDEKEIAKLEKLVAKGDAKAVQHGQSALFSPPHAAAT